MRALLVTVGSHGDLHPFIAVGRALADRGHSAAILTNPYFAPLIRSAGLQALDLGDEAVDLKDLIGGSDAMHHRKGVMTVLKKMLLPLLPTVIERTEQAVATFKPDVIVSHTICLGVEWVAAKHRISWAVATLAPLSWFNPADPVCFGPNAPANPGPLYMKLNRALARVAMRMVFDRPLNKLRRARGLPKQRDIFFAESLGGAANLGLWSPLFRPPLAGDPPTGRICGFPWFDKVPDASARDDELERFLADSEQSREGPPIVFTLGTAAVHVAGRFYHDAARACEILGRRGILLVGRSEYDPGALPPTVRAFTYAPYSTLLPRAAATVHHGGIGSTAQGLRSGRPTVIVPHAHDQFDNAARARRLGVSETVARPRLTADRLAAALQRVLGTPDYAARASAICPRVAAEDGGTEGAQILESLR